ncbi:D-Ala-D-Ala carboxypeptidase family metallohydrolase, partial [Cribrihabitans sp. XS_ASV171]
ADPSLDEKELAEYFVVDEDRSRPFDPQLRLNPATVQIPRGVQGAQRTAMLMNSANWFARMNRRNRFHAKLAEGYTGPIIVSEGDSWFQYPILLKDTIDHLMTVYAVYSLGAAGDLLKRMADQQEYMAALSDTGARVLLLSGGGNDLVAGGALASHLEEFHPDLAPADYLLPSFQALLNDALSHYGRMFRQVQHSFPHVSIICHGYDYPVPNNDRWLCKPMASRGIRDRGLQKAIAADMMDQFNRGLRRLAGSMPHVTYIDCRRVVGDHRWHDGLHPTDAGYRDVAQKFANEIHRIANSRAMPPRVISGPFGRASELTRAMGTPEIVTEEGPRGMSLHVGLNTVDPGHYAGWDGALTACEADAHAMQAIAVAEGFEPVQLLTADATRAQVVAEIERAAKELVAGDMFLFTVSGHGGRIPDFNQDEDHDGDQKMDETLCLYDFQIADDELYMLWTKFRPGVRVLMVPDTCHSGSMARFGPSLPASLFGQQLEVGPAVRAMPLYVEDKVWRANEAAYRDASKSYGALKESVMMSPLSTPIRASVLNLGACKDEQFAMDGPQNGAFTGALLQVWDGGRFAGDYHAFRTAIDQRIGDPSQTPQLFDRLQREPVFTGHRPFTLRPETRPAGIGTPVVHGPTPAQQTDQDEGMENDILPEAEVEAIYARKARGPVRSRSVSDWPDYPDFDAFIRSLGLVHFSTDEFLILGGAHNTPGGSCAGKNTYPPRHLWPNIAGTARVLDQLRARLGRPVAITNAYRAPAYNACIGGAGSSLHMQFNALDFQVRGMAAPEVAMALRWMRDREGLFTGGIGRYNSFTHVDTRGHPSTWPADFRDQALPAQSPLGPQPPRNVADRLARIEAVDLGPARSATRGGGASAFASEVSRDASGFDPQAATAAHQQALKAAVSAKSVISFVENLTPGQKEDVLLSTLFAQRAADAKADPVADREQWLDQYME